MSLPPPHQRRGALSVLSAAVLSVAVLSVAAILPRPSVAAAPDDDLAVIRRDVRSGLSNGGWRYDRYQDLESLDAGRTITVADLQGPGIIRHIHTTRHHPHELFARGIVIEIWFDDAETPAVRSPLADFFGDGCGGRSELFTSSLIECAPWSYNAYIPMPFRKRARVLLRNDTTRNAMNYSYVEWESLPRWRDDLGYFHATYHRRSLRLTPETALTTIEIEGSGHLLGRQYSVVTDEPWFRDFHLVMEGNNEIDIDGRIRAFDYLGTEDSFTFSWGFQETFAGLHAGMPYVDKGDVCRLSIYRFHDAMPIRFRESLRWTIRWSEERAFTGQPGWKSALARDGCRVDLATVHYWYLDRPGGYRHEALRPVPERRKEMLTPSGRTPPELDARCKRLVPDPRLENPFATREDAERVEVVDPFPSTHPFWIDAPTDRGGHPGQPNPGRRGILAVHPRDRGSPCYILRKVRLPSDGRWSLRVVASGDPWELPGESDTRLRLGAHDGAAWTWGPDRVIDAGSPPSPGNWVTLELPLGSGEGRTVTVAVEVSGGGAKGVWANEEAFLDELSVVAVKE